VRVFPGGRIPRWVGRRGRVRPALSFPLSLPQPAFTYQASPPFSPCPPPLRSAPLLSSAGEWFHLDCMRMSRPPSKGEQWYCPSCRVIPKFAAVSGRNRKGRG
jgi:hypothetical protein